MEDSRYPDDTKALISQLKPQLADEYKKLTRHYEDLDRLRHSLHQKIELVEHMELENLETHLLLEQRLRSHEGTGRSEVGARQWTGVSMNAQVQTEMSNSQVVERERALAVREGELEVNKFRSR